MACPNQNEDQKILEAIEQRKAEQTPVQQTMTYIWPGRLVDFLMFHPEDEIILIERQNENWVILTKWQ